VERVLSQT